MVLGCLHRVRKIIEVALCWGMGWSFVWDFGKTVDDQFLTHKEKLR